jgi:hypothetical protein
VTTSKIAAPRRIVYRYFLAGQEVDEAAFTAALAAAGPGERIAVFKLHGPEPPDRWRLTEKGRAALAAAASGEAGR